MSQVETVALWAGLFAGGASIILSGVAIWFAWAVNNRASDVNDRTLRALERIEGEVSRQTDDTRELIKAAWDRMLGSMLAAPSVSGSDAANQFASGITAEIRAELEGDTGDTVTGAVGRGDTNEVDERIERLLDDLDRQLAVVLQARSLRPQRDDPSSLLLTTVRLLSPSSRALLSAIRERHLSRSQYSQLREGTLGREVAELRQAGLLVPLRGDGEQKPVYWFPPDIGDLMSVTLRLGPPSPASVHQLVASALGAVGYEPAPPVNLRD